MRKTSKKLIIIIISILLLSVLLLWPMLFVNYRSIKLIKAIEIEDVGRVKELLEQGVDPNKTDYSTKIAPIWSLFEFGATQPLSTACDTGNLEIVKLLLSHGAVAKGMEDAGWSPLRSTLFYYHPDDVEMVKLLLQNGADANEEPDDLPMLIFVAANMTPKVYDKTMANGTVFAGDYDSESAKGITEIVFMLLGEQSVNIRNEQAQTLLMSAVKNENVYLVEYLMQAGCDINAVDRYEKNALYYANELGNEAIISLLKDN